MKVRLFLVLFGMCFSVYAGSLEIVKAEYGTTDEKVAIPLEKIIGMKDKFYILDARGNMGMKDPFPGKTKKLYVTYKIDGQEESVRILERKTRIILATDILPADEDGVLFAWYGSGLKWRDVLPKIQKLVADGAAERQVNNTTMGGDPDKGNPKKLVVIYSKGGKVAAKFFGEKENFDAAKLMD